MRIKATEPVLCEDVLRDMIGEAIELSAEKAGLMICVFTLETTSLEIDASDCTEIPEIPADPEVDFVVLGHAGGDMNTDAILWEARLVSSVEKILTFEIEEVT